MIMSKELKCCPFCGCEAEVFADRDMWYVECKVCHTNSGRYETEEHAIIAWNYREIFDSVKPVIHCKECHNWDKSWEPINADPGDHFCPILGLSTNANFYCARADAVGDMDSVPSEMAAREFVREYHRMCRTNHKTCQECPMFKNPCFIGDVNEEMVSIVEQWAKEHPEKKRKTYAEDFHKKHPNALYDSDGTPRSCKRYIYGLTNTPCKTNGCTACWNEEMRKEV